MYDAVVESFKWDAVLAFVDLDKLEALSSPEFRNGIRPFGNKKIL